MRLRPVALFFLLWEPDIRSREEQQRAEELSSFRGREKRPFHPSIHPYTSELAFFFFLSTANYDYSEVYRNQEEGGGG